VKKIFSILLALGLVLGMSLVTMPVGADVSAADVTVDPACELEEAEYTIEFDITASLDAGSNHIYIEFPPGTGFPEDLDDLDITVNTVPVFDGEKWLVNATTLKFMVPAFIADGASVEVVIDSLINPVEGEYTLAVWTDRPADETPVDSNPYDIIPKKSTYKFVLDFDTTYTGIGPDVIPPFQACGQEDWGWEDAEGNWYTEFDITFANEEPAGCEGYDPVRFNFELLSAPEGGVATLWLDIYEYELEITADPEDAQGYYGPAGGFELPAEYTSTTAASLHFNVPGDYEFYFELKFLGETPECEPEIPGDVIVSRTETIQVMQHKDAIDVDPFGEKWNFFSPPLKLKYDAPEQVFAPVVNNLKSVWHWDNAQGKWFYWDPDSELPNELQSLTKIEHGKGYMVRMLTEYEGFELPVPVLWLFGHANAYAPDPPFAYNVVPGWTMMGFTSLAPMLESAYLAPASYTLVYGLDNPTQLYEDMDGENLEVGQGYWVYFTAAGQVVP